MTIADGTVTRGTRSLVIAVLVAACGGDSATRPAIPEHVLKLEPLTTTQLEARILEAVSPVPTVVVRDENGRPVSDVEVTFMAIRPKQAAYGDSVANTTIVTDSHGIASVGAWILGSKAGEHPLQASILDQQLVPGASATHHVLVFTAQAKPGPSASLSMGFGDKQVGLPGEDISPPQVHVTDRFGNDAINSAITFSTGSGGGSVGAAEFGTGWVVPASWRLGTVPGLNTVIARAPGLDSLTFTAQAIDAGAIRWYDLSPSGSFPVSGSLALTEDGGFVLVTVEPSEEWPSEWRERQHGTYTVSGEKIVLTFSTGMIEEGTISSEALSLVHQDLNWSGSPPKQWNFVKRR